MKIFFLFFSCCNNSRKGGGEVSSFPSHASSMPPSISFSSFPAMVLLPPECLCVRDSLCLSLENAHELLMIARERRRWISMRTRREINLLWLLFSFFHAAKQMSSAFIVAREFHSRVSTLLMRRSIEVARNAPALVPTRLILFQGGFTI